MAAERMARIKRRLVVGLVVLVLLALVAGAAAQWLRPLSQPAAGTADDAHPHTRDSPFVAMAL